MSTIYIATPVTSRPEPTLERKMHAAKFRIETIKRLMRDDQYFQKYSTITHTNLDEVRAEPDVMGSCIRAVLSADAIFMDNGWTHSRGCRLEHTAARLYNKKIYYYELDEKPNGLESWKN